MMSRRTVLNGPAFGGLLASLAPAAEAEPGGAAGPQKDTEQAMQEVAKAIQDLRDEIKRQDGFWELGPLRDPIKMFLRTTGSSRTSSKWESTCGSRSTTGTSAISSR